MARPTTWRRSFGSFVNGNSGVSHSVQIAPVNAGETVTRVRLQYQWTALPSIPLGPWGVQMLMGVTLQDTTSSTLDLDLVADANSESWMWWEGAPWAGQEVFVKPGDTDPTEVLTAPLDGGYRDIKAQRICTANGYLWLTMASDPAGGTQAQGYFSYAASTLVLLPPGT